MMKSPHTIDLANQVEGVIKSSTPQEYHEVLAIVARRWPWRPTRTGLINVLDQFLHALFAVVVFLPITVWPSYWGAALSGFLLGGIREYEQFRNQDLNIPMIRDRLMDASFFAVGAVILYHFTH